MAVVGGCLLLALSSPPASPPRLSISLEHPHLDERTWIRDGRSTPEAKTALKLMAAAERHGFRSERYLTPALQSSLSEIEAQPGERAALRAEAALTEAFFRFASDVRAASAEVQIVDLAASPKTLTLAETLRRVRRDGPGQVVRLAPEYERLADTLEQWRWLWRDLPRLQLRDGPDVPPGATDERVPALRARLGLASDGASALLDPALASRLQDFQRWHGLDETGILNAPTVSALNRDPADYEKLILINMDRLRALPTPEPRRRVQVNVASGILTAMEDGDTVLTMRVVVGRRDTPTPMLAGAVRYLVLNPYWNVPQDLVQSRVAPEALVRGDAALKAGGFEALSDWSPKARRLRADEIDWKAVAAGERRVRVRQVPGDRNMMGAVKFMLPNDLGVYLHDTPSRGLFSAAQRAFSAGCVRLEDAQAFGRWIAGRNLAELADGSAEQRVDLAEPVPVYLLYLTAAPRPGGGLILGPDPYGWDRL
ncbi:L,D-transpeptidase family protein [Brevundimonas diminuta]|uniref:L,D-transpeptidase family protein n=1 Tax=Brevundimonas diminuta TaxID=293 RepID=UPI0035DF77A5